MAKIPTIERKGIYENNGKIETQAIYTEGIGKTRDILMIPDYREITCLSDFFALLKELHTEEKERLIAQEKKYGSTFLYRGQANINHTYIPSALRKSDDIKREHLLFKEFYRQFYEVFDECKSAFEQETILQHFGCNSRCLDLLENPLYALFAACEGFSTSQEIKDTTKYGEVSIWYIDNDNLDLRLFDSNTVSIICNISKQDSEFFLGQLEIDFLREHPTELRDYIFIKDILRRSVIARPKFNNQRIKNQKSYFLVMSSNKLIDKEDYEGTSFERKFGISVDDFSDYILTVEERNRGMSFEYTHPNVFFLRQNLHTLGGVDFSKLTVWDLKFLKQTEEESDFIDTFDIYKYLYSTGPECEKERHPIYAVIPPKAKAAILEELKYLGITKAFMYPDMQNVADELKNAFYI